MKTQQEFLKKRPKSGCPITIKTLKGGCWYFAVVRDATWKFTIIKPFVVHGKPFHEDGSWKVRIGGSHSLDGEDMVLRCSYYGILPHKDDMVPLKVYGGYVARNWDFTPGSIFLGRTFRYTAKVWDFYKKIVDSQDAEAYKEAIKATL